MPEGDWLRLERRNAHRFCRGALFYEDNHPEPKGESGFICNGVVQMKTRDPFESEILGAYEKGELKSIGRSKAGLETFRDAARATLIKNRRVNIRLSSPGLMDIQTRALEEGELQQASPDR